jgi:CIC family chloride channel protein
VTVAETEPRHGDAQARTTFEAQRFLLLAVLIGVCTGLLVVCFHASIELVDWYVRDAATGPVARVLVPGLGAAIAAWIVYMVPAGAGSGIVQTKAALYVSDGRIPLAAVPGKFLACVVSIGTGTPLGPEDPALLMGAGLASRLGSTFGLTRRTMRLIAPVGAAAGIAAAFNTPITGVLFVMEEVVAGWDAAVMGSIVLAAVSSVVTTRMFLGESPLFRVPDVAGMASPAEALTYVALGVAAGLFATVYVKGAALLRYRLGAFRLPVAIGPLLAGLVVGAVGLVVPDVLGTGYRSMDAALNLQYGWETMAWLAAAKLLVAALAFAVGTPGGLFAPTLFLGVMLGGAFGGLAPEMLPMVPMSQSMLALAGMAGVFAGVFRAPMTAVFMTFELSGTSASILPAMLTSTLGFLIARQFQRTSILDLVAEHEGANLPSARLARADEPLHIEDVLQPPNSVLRLDGRSSLSEALAAAGLDEAIDQVLVSLPGSVWGVLPRRTLDALAAAGVEPTALVTHAALARVAPAYPDELLDVALRLLARAPVVPVVSRLDDRRLLGVVTLADVTRAYGLA